MSLSHESAWRLSILVEGVSVPRWFPVVLATFPRTRKSHDHFKVMFLPKVPRPTRVSILMPGLLWRKPLVKKFSEIGSFHVSSRG